ncbi:MAG: DegQ family serine endoprotease [Gammaproteobacteria bacterium]
MKNNLARTIAGMTVALLFAANAAQAAMPVSVNGQNMPTLAPMIEKAAPAVVNIATSGSVEVQSFRNPFMEDPFFRRFFEMEPDQPQRRNTQSAGSGVIVDAKRGYVLTNAHVIENADEITVTLQDDRTYTAEIIGTDPGSDIAVIKIDADDLIDIPLADSDDVRVGDFVVAIGNPFGLGHTVTSGIISALGRSGLNPNGYEDFIQTDASINPGNSGGALVNLNGELVGVNSAILTRSGGNIGIGFAIPTNMIKVVMDQLLEFGEVRRGLLGVNIYTVTPDIAKAYGVDEISGALISQVVPDSAAYKAGLEPGDIITSVNGEKIKSATELRNAIGMQRVGAKVRLEIVRDGDTRNLTAELGEGVTSAEPVTAADIHQGLAGAELTDADTASGGPAGVLVASVANGSPAAQRGLRAGDVIVAVNRQRISNVQALRDVAEGSPSLLLNIKRGNTALLLPIR